MQDTITTKPAARVNILGVGVDPVDPQKAALILETRIKEGGKGYVCLAGVHGDDQLNRPR